MAADCSIVFALYPGVTQLDFTGPAEVLARLPGARCVLASVLGGELESDSKLTFSRLLRLADVPRAELLCVPGGSGSTAAMEDPAYLAELRRLAAGAKYVTSVCTGSLLLAAAGLLRGRRAACHWAFRDLLAPFGVTPDPARVVRDGNVFTGGGVTAGIDLGLAVTAEIAGRDFAEAVQLGLEYAPAPPFDAGRPEQARPEIVQLVEQRFAPLRRGRAAAVGRIVGDLG